MSAVNVFDAGDAKSGSTASSSLTFVYPSKPQPSPSKPLVIAGQALEERKLALEKEPQPEPGTDSFDLAAYLAAKQASKEPMNLREAAPKLKELYQKGVEQKDNRLLFSHLRQVIEKDAAGCLAELICYAPLDFKDIDEQYSAAAKLENRRVYTLLQHADQHGSTCCRTLLMLYKANGENMCLNMEPATKHKP